MATGWPDWRVIRLELSIVARIENAEDDFFDVVGQAVVLRKHAVDVVGGTRGRLAGGTACPTRCGQIAEALADARQAFGIVFGHVVGHTADRGVQPRAAYGFGIDHLAGCALYEIRPAQAHEARAFDHDDVIAKRGKISAAGNAGTHHRGNLRHTELAPHKGIIVENSPAAILAGEDAVLVGQVDARGVHQIDDGDAVAHGDFLRAQALGDGFGPPGAGLHGGIARDDDGVAALDLADAGDRAEAGGFAFVLVVGQQEADFEEGRARIDQRRDALPCGHLACAMLPLDFGLAAAGAEAFFELVQLVDQVAHVGHARDLVCGGRRFGNCAHVM
jgi:hypothetical protein